MSSDEAKALRPGDRVKWSYPDTGFDTSGSVVSVGPLGITVRWGGLVSDSIHLFDADGMTGVGYVEGVP